MGKIPESDLRLSICATCGTQFDTPEPPKACHICDDPRQYVPPSGQSWTTLQAIQAKHHNIIKPLHGSEDEIYIINTEPRFPIGQRAFLIRTPKGNILWDLIALIDEDTIQKVNALGGLSAIVISHPHYYTTHLTWSRAFGDIPVYLASNDRAWLSRRDVSSLRRFITSPIQEILPGSDATAIKTGGHFPGSMVLHWKKRLFVADSVGIVPSGGYDIDRPPGTVSFTFMWSYPNMIPLPAKAISVILRAIEPYEFDMAHGAFPGLDVFRGAKPKLIESARIVQGILGGIMPGEQAKREFWL